LSTNSQESLMERKCIGEYVQIVGNHRWTDVPLAMIKLLGCSIGLWGSYGTRIALSVITLSARFLRGRLRISIALD